MNRPKVIAFNSALGGSNAWPASGVRGRYRCASHSASTPAGTCRANSQGQDVIDMIAAATDGPAADDVATIIALSPIPRPSASRGKLKRTSAPFTLMMPAPPKPCSTRPSTSSGSDGANAQTNEASVKSASPSE
jgi:hypothetical protein